MIELLVVVAIIALLLAILMPAMNQARIVAKQAVCASNLHQQGIGLMGYLAENQFYPGAHGLSSEGSVVGVWVTRIRKYTDGNRDVFYCPSEPEGWKWQNVTGSGSGFATSADKQMWAYHVGELLLRVDRVPFSYGYNDWGGEPYHGTSYDSNQRGLGGDIRFGPFAQNELPAGRVVNPGQMIAIADNLNVGNWRFNIDPTTPTEYPSDIHRDGANFLFCDGHVQWRLQSDSVTGSANYDGWTPEQRAIARLWNNTNQWDPR